MHVGRRSDDIAGQRGSTAHTHTQTHSIPIGQSTPPLSTLPVRPGQPQLQRPNLARTSALRRLSRPSGPERSVERSARAVHALCREKRGRAGVVRGGESPGARPDASGVLPAAATSELSSASEGSGFFKTCHASCVLTCLPTDLPTYLPCSLAHVYLCLLAY